METVTSKDGTIIAFDRAGSGPTLILVGGAFEQRAMESEIAFLAAHPLLARHFTVVHYDRRGRGDSTDTLPYALEREFEDIEALIDRVGGPAYVRHPSGASLALEAALALGDKVRSCLYEPPTASTPRASKRGANMRTGRHPGGGRHGDTVEHFMMLVGPSPGDLERSAVSHGRCGKRPTLAYDTPRRQSAPSP